MFSLHHDDVRGTAEYGDPQDDTQPWSLPWSLLEVEEFLFATGDKEKWIIVNKVQLIGADGTKEYNKGNITVRASSGNCDPYQGNPIHNIVPLIRVTSNH